MSVRRFCADQPTHFAFTPANEAQIERILARYPEQRRQSGVIPLLWLAQKQNGGHLTQKALEAVALRLSMPFMRVYEVATFYSMFNLAPVGQYFVQVCTTTPCMLAGSDGILEVCKKRIHPEQNHVREDGVFSWLEVECLGACANAPMVQINDDYYEDLTPANFAAVLDGCEKGSPLRPGPQPNAEGVARHGSEPAGSVPANRTQPVNAAVHAAAVG